MELNERNIIIDDSLNRIAEAGMESYITHAFCSAGECMIVVANRQVTRMKPSVDFRVNVVYVDFDFINVCAAGYIFAALSSLYQLVFIPSCVTQKRMFR